jgi:hypothetical protein
MKRRRGLTQFVDDGASLPSTTMRLIRFSSWRTFPAIVLRNIRDSSQEMPWNGLLYWTEYFFTKWSVSIGISSRRSRSAES